ncbi:M61 family metallopeptidase [Flavivirga algicola]|uniref:Amidohydrolase family protein n=1 Tax=Flavivirga algicola TaxID=2729136 RepID=A0ABX1S1E7_9FLAO|nr:amidohydrolase family protein [Flavivirga algicola]NMH89075.1 amidohydrolase family protein [Flavivirga algicola]
MKHLFQIVLFITIFKSFSATKHLNQNLESNLDISCTIDLTQVVDDMVPVTINVNDIKGNSITYRFPKVVQGTYAISDFGRFVHNFKAFDKKGKELKVSQTDTNSWEINKAKKLSKITYFIQDTYDLKEGEINNIPQFPAGTNIDPDNYILNLHGFIGYFNGLENSNYNITISAPESYKYATALSLKSSSKNLEKQAIINNFYASRYFDVIDNPIIYGHIDIETFNIDDIEIVISTYSPNKIYTAKEIKGVVQNTMKSQVNYLKNYGTTTSRYDIQIYFFDGEKINPKDYGALEHHSSTVMVMPENTPKKELYADLKYFISHEFFHTITPLSIHSEDIHDFDYHNPSFSKHLWLYEGVTEYFSKLFQIDQGLITDQEFYNIISNKIKRSKRYDDAMSSTVMSENILNEPYSKNYPNVYQKGALIGMCLDILIRKESNGKKSLLTLMKTLSEIYGKNTPFKDDDLLEEITKLTYPSVGTFFKNHVEGNAPINYQTYLDMVGLNLVDGKLLVKGNSTDSQLKTKKHWLNKQTHMVIFEHVNVIPMTKHIVLRDQTVVIVDGKIISITSTKSSPKYDADTVIDGTGKYLIPGLSEMHYHWRDNKSPIENEFKLLIANGITTARNMAEYDGQDHIAIREKTKKGGILGPNYFTTGPYLGYDQLKTFEDIERIVKEHEEKKYDFLKIGDGVDIPKENYLKLLDEAYKHNVIVIGHGQHNLPLEYSLRMKSIEHVEEFIYIFQEGNVYEKVDNFEDSKILINDIEYLNNAAKEIKESGLYVAPTLVIFEMILQYFDEAKFAELQKHLESNYLTRGEYEKYLTEKNHYRAELLGKKIVGIDSDEFFENFFVWMKKFTKILNEHQVPLLTGSDTFGMVVPGFSIHKEFEFLQESGLTPYEILKASTVNASRYLGVISMEGTISEGKNANLVLLNKNPLENIKNTQTIEGVMLKGTWLDRVQLDEMLEEVASYNAIKR